MSQLKVERIEAPSLGIDADSAPELVPKGKAPILQNMLPGYPGLIRMRGPLSFSAPFMTATPQDKIAGIWHHGDTLVISIREGHATQRREPHTTWYRKGTAATLSRGVTRLYTANLLDGTVATLTAGMARNLVPGPKFTRQRRYLYGPAYDTASDAGGDIYAADGAGAAWIIRRVALLRFDTQGALAIPVSYADNAPRGSQDAKMHYNRLFVAGGPSGFNVQPTSCATGSFLTDIEPNTIWYTQDFGQAIPDASVNANGDLKAEVCRWAHPITFAKNSITVDSADPSDFIVALAKVGRNLAIFKRNSIHVLLGYGPSTFSVREFASGIGCIDPRSVVEVDNGCFFMAQDGFYYFDGSQLIEMSRGIDAALHEQALAMVGDTGVDGGLVTAAKLSNDYVGLAISDASFGVSGGVRVSSVPKLSTLLHIPTRGWITFTSDVLVTDGQPTWFGSTDTRAYCTDDTAAWAAQWVVAPLVASEAQRGLDGDVGSSFTIDNTTAFTGTGNTLRTGVREAWTVGPGLAPIATSWKSRLIRLGTPLQRAQLHRIAVDYRFVRDGQTLAGVDNAWYVTVYDGDNNIIVPEYRLTTQLDPPTQYSRMRHRKDVFQEVTDLYVKIEWLGPEASLPYADIMDVFVEYQVSREYH